jgi:hypothetical protein
MKSIIPEVCVRVLVSVYTSFLRQPTAKLDYVLFFPPRQFFFQLDPHLHFRIIQQQKKKGKKSTRQKKDVFFLSQQQPFSFGPALISLAVFHVLYLALLSFQQHFWSIKKLNILLVKN